MASKTLRQLAEQTGVSITAMQNRMRLYPIEIATCKDPTYFKAVYIYNRKRYSKADLATMAGKSLAQIDKMPKDKYFKIVKENGNALKEKGYSKYRKIRSQEETEELFDYKGKLLTVLQLAKLAGVTEKEMNCRLDSYHTIEECLNPVA